MPTKTYPFEEGGPDRVELSWKGGRFKNFTVSVDGQQLNQEPYNLKDLQSGQKLPLSDGSSLHVKFEKGFSGGLKVTRDWKPLPGSPTHPKTKAKGASIIMFVIAGLNAVFLAILMGTEGVPDAALMTTGAWILAFVVLGIFVRRGSLAALWAGIILFGADTLWSLTIGAFDFSWLIVRGALLVGLWQALPAMKELKRSRAEATVS